MSMIINPYIFSAGNDTDIPSAYVSALLHMDGSDGSATFTDTRGINTWTAGGAAQIDTSEFVFGGASGLFDGSANTRLTAANNASLQFGTGDFTLAWRARHNTDNGFRTIYDHGYTAANGLLIQGQSDTSTDRLRMIVYMGGVTVLTEGSTPAFDTWYHYELVRSGTSVTLRRNGVSVGSGTSSVNLNSTDGIGLGGRFSPAQHYMDGWLDEFLILKGLALHVTDFTPPSVPYTIV